MAKVLIADDSTLVRRVLKLSLEACVPCEVLEAADGQAALALARAERPWVAVLDIQMPGLNGLEVCAHLKADESTRRVHVMILTGNGDDAVRDQALSLGADSFYVKPAGARELGVHVKAILTGQAARPT